MAVHTSSDDARQLVESLTAFVRSTVSEILAKIDASNHREVQSMEKLKAEMETFKLQQMKLGGNSLGNHLFADSREGRCSNLLDDSRMEMCSFKQEFQDQNTVDEIKDFHQLKFENSKNMSDDVESDIEAVVKADNSPLQGLGSCALVEIQDNFKFMINNNEHTSAESVIESVDGDVVIRTPLQGTGKSSTTILEEHTFTPVVLELPDFSFQMGQVMRKVYINWRFFSYSYTNSGQARSSVTATLLDEAAEPTAHRIKEPKHRTERVFRIFEVLFDRLAAGNIRIPNLEVKVYFGRDDLIREREGVKEENKEMSLKSSYRISY